MIDLKSLSITIGNTDISKLVTNVNIMESIKGGVKGTLSFQDNINFLFRLKQVHAVYIWKKKTTWCHQKYKHKIN